MKKKKTLRKNYEFKNVLTKGKMYAGKQILIYISKNKLNENLIGIAISSKLCNAVKRNNIKRKIKENYRLIEDNNGMKAIFIKMILFYQKRLSPLISSTGIKCKYYPSCSEYTKQAIEKYGSIRGVCLGIIRILKCNPFSKGGYDPLK